MEQSKAGRRPPPGPSGQSACDLWALEDLQWRWPGPTWRPGMTRGYRWPRDLLITVQSHPESSEYTGPSSLHRAFLGTQGLPWTPVCFGEKAFLALQVMQGLSDFKKL